MNKIQNGAFFHRDRHWVMVAEQFYLLQSDQLAIQTLESMVMEVQLDISFCTDIVLRSASAPSSFYVCRSDSATLLTQSKLTQSKLTQAVTLPSPKRSQHII
jgi:hypothetical protein